jgi:surface protein
MFKGNHKYGISAVLAINSAWGTSNPTNWSQTNAQLKTAPFETRDQLMAAISGLPNGAAQPYPTSAAVYGTIDTWLFDPGLTSFRSIFSAKDISTWPSISNWDVQNVTDMKSMFEGASGLDQHAITGWDVANVEDMSSMFRNCTSFDQNITSWDVSMVEDMSSMFEGCTDIPDGLRQNIQNWTVGNVDYFNDMFKNSGRWPVDTVLAINAAWGTSNPTTQSIAQLLTAPFETPNQVIVAIDLWYTSPATYADTYGNMSSWDFASTLTDFSGLFFRNGAELTTFNEDISGWDVSNVTNMSKMFKGCSSFNRNLASWGQKVGNVTDMTSMFEDCTSMDVTNQESLKHWNVSSVGVTAVNNSELWSVDYCFDSSGYTTLVSGDDNGNSYNPAGVYVTLTGQVGVWNRTKGMVYAWTSPTAVGTNAKYDISGLDSCLDDGGVVYKAKTNVDFVWNITNKNHQAFSPEGHHQYFNSGLDRFQKTNAGYEVTSIRSISFPGPMLGEFRNLPPGAYTMRIFGQTHSEISVPTHISDTGLTSVVNIGQFSAGGQSPASPTATQAYVDFTGLSPEATLYSSSDAIGFSMQPKAGQVVHSMGGVQLKREFEVSRFKDMFKNSSWTTASASVVSQIDAAWGNTTTTNPDTNLIHGNANWWKNEAKLSE